MLVTCAPDLIYLADTDGDGRSDHREVLLTGFSTAGSTQLRASHPQLGLDNWIYVTGGLTGGRVTSPKNPDHAFVEFGRADLRFLPDCSRFEVAEGGGQFGMTFDDFGHRFICYNRVQIQHVVLPGRYLRRNPHLQADQHGARLPGRDGGRAAGRAWRLVAPLSDQQEHHHGRFARRHVYGRLRRDGVSLHGLPETIAAGPFPAIRRATWFISIRWSRPGDVHCPAIARAERIFGQPDDWFRPVNLAQGPTARCTCATCTARRSNIPTICRPKFASIPISRVAREWAGSSAWSAATLLPHGAGQ